MRIITPTEVRPHKIDGTPHRLYAWANGNTASLVRFLDPGGMCSQGARGGLYEIATMTPDGGTVDVVGYLDETGVQRELERRQDEPAGMVYEY